MEELLFGNIGRKIKGFAMASFWIETIGAIIVGFALIGDTDGLSLLYGLGGIAVALIAAWFLYGFGEIIEKLSGIEANTRGTGAQQGGKAATAGSVNPAPAPISSGVPRSYGRSQGQPAAGNSNAQAAPGNGWKCSCGKVHPPYVSSCSCGKNKNDLQG